MTQNQIRNLSRILNTGLVLYVPPENRKPLVEFLADRLVSEFDYDVFVQACLAESNQINNKWRISK